MEEVWKKVPSLGGHIEASDQGRIRNVEYKVVRGDGQVQTVKARVRTLTVGKNGYYHFRYEKKTVYVHSCVAESFLGKRTDKTVNHIDGDKLNNRPSNLEYASYSENNQHAYKTGLRSGPRKYGEESSHHTLEDWQVKVIKDNARLPKKDRTSQRVLGERFGVTQACVSLIVNGKTWSVK